MTFDVSANLVLIVMGVAGCGKSTVGRALADSLGWTFLEADDFHPASNIDKMRRSEALSDEDRVPWLNAMIARLKQSPEGRVVLACSALTRAIRARFRNETPAEVVFVYIKVDRARLLQRLLERKGHFAQASLLASQLATLEEPVDALTVDSDETPAALCSRIRERLAERYPGSRP